MFRIVLVVNSGTIYIEYIPACLDRISLNRYNALDEISLPIVWWNKNKNVATGGFMEIENFLYLCQGL